MIGYVIRNGLPYVTMAVGETLDWSLDWSDQLDDGETIIASVWEVGTGLTAGASGQAGPVTKQWLTSPTAGSYVVTNQVTTSAARVMRRTITVGVVVAK